MPFSQARPSPRPEPSQTPSGPSRKAVTGIITSIDRNGTKTICTFSGKIRFNPRYSGASTATMINGTNTCPPYSFSCIGRPKMSATQEVVPSVSLVVHTVLAALVSAMKSGVITAAITVAPTQGSTFSFFAALYAP